MNGAARAQELGLAVRVVAVALRQARSSRPASGWRARGWYQAVSPELGATPGSSRGPSVVCTMSIVLSIVVGRPGCCPASHCSARRMQSVKHAEVHRPSFPTQIARRVNKKTCPPRTRNSVELAIQAGGSTPPHMENRPQSTTYVKFSTQAGSLSLRLRLSSLPT